MKVDKKRSVFSGKMLVSALVLAMALSVSGPVSGSEKKGKPMNANNETSAILSVMGYGFNVKILINGKDAGIKGGKSENKRLFFSDSKQLDEMPPDLRKSFALLKRGENKFSVDFKKVPGSQSSGLEIVLALDTDPEKPLFTIKDAGQSSGQMEKTVTIQ